jgi:hypothetical protein
VAIGGSCTGGDDAGPPPTSRPETSTSIIDHTGVVLPGVGGQTTTTVVETGRARLVGTVSGPDGPLPGATVRVQRLIGDQARQHDVVTDANGRWELRDVPGGRYRVRAFQAPAYAQTTAEVRFLADAQEHVWDLRLDDQREVLVRADAAPDPPRLDADVNVVVVVAQRTVGADGIVRAVPLGGAFVELTGLGRWVLRDEATDPTGSTSTTFSSGATFEVGAILSEEGRARFELRCVAAGDPQLALRIPVVVAPAPGPAAGDGATTTTGPSTEAVALELPACVDGAEDGAP